jgi:hypothetical protein
MKRTLLLTLCQVFLLPGANAFDDVVTLKDGRTIPGLVGSGGTEEIPVKIGDNSQWVAVDQIQSIRFDHSLTLPADTEIAIRTIDPIDSENIPKDNLKQEYSASLDDPIVVNGVEVVPAAAKAVLRVTDLTKPRKINVGGRVSLFTSLVAVMIDGQRIEVKTDKVDSKSGTRAKRTAIGAGVGAGVGAAVGAGVGGAAGAAIGAGAGAAVGAATGIFKGPPPVKIAPETRFTYRLMQGVVIDDRGPTLPASVQADTITLRDGTSVTGSWESLDAEQINFLVNNKPGKYPRSQVTAVTFGPPPAKPPAKAVIEVIEPPKPPADAPPAPPATVSLGQSIDRVVAILGQPRNIADLGSKKIYTFPDLKVTFVDGKVTDVQ